MNENTRERDSSPHPAAGWWWWWVGGAETDRVRRRMTRWGGFVPGLNRELNGALFCHRVWGVCGVKGDGEEGSAYSQLL